MMDTEIGRGEDLRLAKPRVDDHLSIVGEHDTVIAEPTVDLAATTEPDGADLEDHERYRAFEMSGGRIAGLAIELRVVN